MKTHRYVTTEWSAPGYFGRATCACCGFDMLGENRILTVTHRSGRATATICDGCVNAIATEADGKQIHMDGTEVTI
jgi:hypothetical protein